ncbi:D-glyceryl-ACP synthase [Nocardia amikacinitolerans]|uniref:HAD-IIIC family phosphatase n=1 Tax=Nocardia amikacinitolerans TaxID=756689 RepID=UPI000B112C3C|nr:HAD-IIIC family phosphatase [Nocardia amikacinitolerans]MCP2321421.1 D-glyceryl-ACP synthase [Nocardia amikacinitolerans]
MSQTRPGDGDSMKRTTSHTSVIDLYRSGRLIDEYPTVRWLLADLSDAELIRAGRVLARLDPTEIVERHPSTAVLRVALTGHGTFANLVPALTAELARHGVAPRYYVADFDSFVFELADSGSMLYAAKPDMTLCLLDPMLVFDELKEPWRADDVDQILKAKLGLIENLVATFRAQNTGILVLNTLPLLRRFTAQLIDHSSRAKLGALWRDANSSLLRMSEANPTVAVVDLDPIIADGVPASDARMSQYAKAHLSSELLASYARTAGHIASHLCGRTRKALVVDLDDTLWGGTVGEDGIDGIDVADGPRGQAFTAFQRVVKQVASQGVLLAAVSKNEPNLVRQVLQDHPGMTLREHDFVNVIANWHPKWENLTELAATLNLSTDGFVYIDDSSFECGLVRNALPGVAVLQVDEEPAFHVETLLHDGWFDGLQLTDEDRIRVNRYRDDVARKDFLDSFDSVEAYLHELRVQVRLSGMTPEDVPRVAQLTLRTNQFNLTTIRLQEGQVRDLLADPHAQIVTIRSQDRFGDNGLVGAIFIRWEEQSAHIENFLLSCRVFSRGIEHASLAQILHRARGRGTKTVYGHYRRTTKNTKVADFYRRYGFVQVSADESRSIYSHDLDKIIEPPAFVHVRDEIEGAR